MTTVTVDGDDADSVDDMGGYDDEGENNIDSGVVE